MIKPRILRSIYGKAADEAERMRRSVGRRMMETKNRIRLQFHKMSPRRQALKGSEKKRPAKTPGKVHPFEKFRSLKGSLFPGYQQQKTEKRTGATGSCWPSRRRRAIPLSAFINKKAPFGGLFWCLAFSPCIGLLPATEGKREEERGKGKEGMLYFYCHAQDCYRLLAAGCRWHIEAETSDVR